MNRAELVKRIADLVNEKVLTGISDVRDESDENTRVVIELKRDGNPKVIINNLYKHTALESSFSVNMLAIDHGKPKLLVAQGRDHLLHRAPARGRPAPHALPAATRRKSSREARRLSHRARESR